MATTNSTPNLTCDLYQILDRIADQDFFPETADKINHSGLALDMLRIELECIIAMDPEERIGMFIDFAARCIEAGQGNISNLTRVLGADELVQLGKSRKRRQS